MDLFHAPWYRERVGQDQRHIFWYILIGSLISYSYQIEHGLSFQRVLYCGFRTAYAIGKIMCLLKRFMKTKMD